VAPVQTMNFRVILFCGIIFFVACTSAMPVDDKADPVLAVFDQAARDDASPTEGFAAPAMPAHVTAAMDTLDAYFNNQVERTETEDLQEHSSAGCAWGCYISYHYESHWNEQIAKGKTRAQREQAFHRKSQYINYCLGIPAAYAGHWWLTPEIKCKHYAHQNCNWRCPVTTPTPSLSPPVTITEATMTMALIAGVEKTATGSSEFTKEVQQGVLSEVTSTTKQRQYTSEMKTQARGKASWMKGSAEAEASGEAEFSSKMDSAYQSAMTQTSTMSKHTEKHTLMPGSYWYQAVITITLSNYQQIEMKGASMIYGAPIPSNCRETRLI